MQAKLEDAEAAGLRPAAAEPRGRHERAHILTQRDGTARRAAPARRPATLPLRSLPPFRMWVCFSWSGACLLVRLPFSIEKIF